MEKMTCIIYFTLYVGITSGIKELVSDDDDDDENSDFEQEADDENNKIMIFNYILNVVLVVLIN